jgi:hypothetical protein
MPARVRVCIFLNGCDQFYQREGEYREGTKFVVKPSFVIDRRAAITVSEQAGLVLVERLRKLGAKPWLEDVETQRRIDPANAATTNFTEDTRIPMKASLDDQNYFAVRPANTVEGPRWFVRCTVPGRPEPDVIYSETILGALQRAEDVGFLAYGERAPAPEPQPAAPVARNSSVVRRRPGDRYD